MQGDCVIDIIRKKKIKKLLNMVKSYINTPKPQYLRQYWTKYGQNLRFFIFPKISIIHLFFVKIWVKSKKRSSLISRQYWGKFKDEMAKKL